MISSRYAQAAVLGGILQVTLAPSPAQGAMCNVAMTLIISSLPSCPQLGRVVKSRALQKKKATGIRNYSKKGKLSNG